MGLLGVSLETLEKIDVLGFHLLFQRNMVTVGLGIEFVFHDTHSVTKRIGLPYTRMLPLRILAVGKATAQLISFCLLGFLNSWPNMIRIL